MEIDIVLHRIGLGVDERHLDIVTLVHDQERSRNRAVEGHGLKLGALIIDDNLLLLRHEPEFHDLWTLLGLLLVRVHEWWRDEFDLLSRQHWVLRDCW